MATKLKSGDTLVFMGDSITDTGRCGEHKPYGFGYANMVINHLTNREPAKKINYLNRGIGGNKIFQLRERWEDDCLLYKPNYLTVLIGINDLHEWMLNGEEKCAPAAYAEDYDDILGRTKKRFPRCQIILLDPFYISQDKTPGSYRADILERLAKYQTVVGKLVRKYKTRYIPAHEMFQKLLKHHPAETFCGEPIHPNQTGHQALADAVYAALSR